MMIANSFDRKRTSCSWFFLDDVMSYFYIKYVYVYCVEARELRMAMDEIWAHGAWWNRA